MPDRIFAERRLAEIYDALDDDRADLDVYAAIADELGAHAVLDVGCGTGVFACLLASQGKEVTGVDPAEASLTVARRRAGADRVRWMLGTGPELPEGEADLVTMTGNVAQVFVEHREWAATLAAAHRAIRPAGHLVFEVRDPAERAWEAWTRADSHRVAEIDGVGRVETWVECTSVNLPLVSFRHTFRFAADGAVLTSDSTLRFRDRDEITGDLQRAGFTVAEVRDAPDRPGKELVFLAVSCRPG